MAPVLLNNEETPSGIAKHRLQFILARDRTTNAPFRPQAISLSDTPEGPVITLGYGEWDDMLADLRAQLAQITARSLFQGAHIRLNVGARDISDTELATLTQMLATFNLTLDLTKTSSQELVDPRLAPPEKLFPSQPPATTPEPIRFTASWQPSPGDGTAENTTMIVRHSLEAGQIIQSAGSVIIVGSVNPAAQVVAGQDVFVLGKLRGVVHAGADGDDTAVIGALLFAPTQIRISQYAFRPATAKTITPFPAKIARLESGIIVVENWLGMGE